MNTENYPAEALAVSNLGIAELSLKNLGLMKQQANDLTITEDGKGYKQVKDAHIQAKNLDLKIRKRVDELNNPLKDTIKKNKEDGDKLQELVSPIIKTLGTKRTDWEKKEAERKEAERKVEAKRISDIRAKIDKMADMPTTVTGLYDSDGILNLASELKGREILFDEYNEFTEEAIKVRDRSYLMLLALHESTKKAEEEAREAEKKQQEYEAEVKRLEEQRKAQEAEQKRIDDERAALALEKQQQELEEKALFEKVNKILEPEKELPEETISAEPEIIESKKAKPHIESEPKPSSDNHDEVRQWINDLLNICPPKTENLLLQDNAISLVSIIHAKAKALLDLIDNENTDRHS